MTSFADLIAKGSANGWLFLPSAVLLGALHGLEPGHSKTLMAAFIVAIRGTVAQAVLLGVAATISHTAIVWIVALGGMHLWQGVAPEAFEPWFQLLSGLIIIAMALWMLVQARRDRLATAAVQGHSHEAGHGHGHGHHHGEALVIDTGHGKVRLEIHEDNALPRFRLTTLDGQRWHARDVAVTTTRDNGAVQRFAFRDRDGHVESFDEIPEPHGFTARLALGHGGHSHDHELVFCEGASPRGARLEGSQAAYETAHERHHAEDIRRRFDGRNITNRQIALFGLTGGLIPCPAAITVLLICLQLKEVALGATMVLAFSIGLALTLVAVGVAAAIGVRQASGRSKWFATLAERAPYVSGLLIIAVGLYVSWHGLAALRST